MKIGVDARLLERKMTGVGRYLLNILKYIPKSQKKWEKGDTKESKKTLLKKN